MKANWKKDQRIDLFQAYKIYDKIKIKSIYTFLDFK